MARNVTRYRRKRPGMSKRARKAYISRRKRYTRYPPKSGFLRTVRCSNLQTTFNCHQIWTGDDTVAQIQDTSQFRLSDLPNYSELQAVFDNYRIVRILYRFVMFRNPMSDFVSVGNRGIYPDLMWVHDYNDSVSIGRAQMMTHANMRELYMTDQRPITRWYSLKPSVLQTVYETGLGAPAYSPKWRQWMDTNDINAPHYGLKVCINNFYSGMAIKLETKYVLEFKGVS